MGKGRRRGAEGKAEGEGEVGVIDQRYESRCPKKSY